MKVGITYGAGGMTPWGPFARAIKKQQKNWGMEREGNLAYYSADLGLAGYGIFFRKPLRPGHGNYINITTSIVFVRFD